MFVRVETRPRRKWPIVTALIVAACVGAFLGLNLMSEAERALALHRWGTVPATLFAGEVPLFSSTTGLRIANLVSAIFVHADWLHLIGNLLFLVVFGVAAERVLGARRFSLLFLGCGALANLVGALTLARASAPIIGSSGAVSAVVGAYLALFPRARLGLVLPLGVFLEFVRMPASLLIGFWALLQLLFTYVGPAFGAVAWWTHIAGFVGGIAFAFAARAGIARRLRN